MASRFFGTIPKNSKELMIVNSAFTNQKNFWEDATA
jgi:hypothetical protein